MAARHLCASFPVLGRVRHPPIGGLEGELRGGAAGCAVDDEIFYDGGGLVRVGAGALNCVLGAGVSVERVGGWKVGEECEWDERSLDG